MEKKTNKCQIIMVSQYKCSRLAEVTRITSLNKEVKLCKKCDQIYGNIVGKRKESENLLTKNRIRAIIENITPLFNDIQIEVVKEKIEKEDSNEYLFILEVLSELAKKGSLQD